MIVEWRNEKDYEAVQQLALRNRVTARRMHWLANSGNFRDLELPTAGRAHFLKKDLAGYFALDLESKTRPARLICRPIGNFEMKDGQYEKESIIEIEIVRIERDYHKK